MNEGRNRYEFLVGDDKKQNEYEEGMRAGAHEGHGNDVAGVSVDPGGKKSFVLTMPKAAGKLLFGCHEPGHYQAGMRGELIYSGSPGPKGTGEPESAQDQSRN